MKRKYMQLVIMAGCGEGETIVLDKETYNIGRNEDNDIVINESIVSRLHASVQMSGDKYILTDHSANGTKVNGITVKNKELIAGDEIEIGNTVFKVEKGGAAVILEKGKSDDKVKSGKGAKSTSGKNKSLKELLKIPLYRFAFIFMIAMFLFIILISFTKETDTIEGNKEDIIEAIINIYIEEGTITSSGIEQKKQELVQMTVEELEKQRKLIMKDESKEEVVPEAKESVDEKVVDMLENPEQLYKLAERLYKERMIKPDNLYISIQKYEELRDYLEIYDRKSRMYKDVLKRYNEAIELLSSEIKNLKSNAAIAISIGEYEKARESLMQIQAMIPDVKDERNVYAKKELKEILNK